MKTCCLARWAETQEKLRGSVKVSLHPAVLHAHCCGFTFQDGQWDPGLRYSLNSACADICVNSCRAGMKADVHSCYVLCVCWLHNAQFSSKQWHGLTGTHRLLQTASKIGKNCNAPLKYRFYTECLEYNIHFLSVWLNFLQKAHVCSHLSSAFLSAAHQTPSSALFKGKPHKHKLCTNIRSCIIFICSSVVFL